MKADEVKALLTAYTKEASDEELLEFIDKMIEKRPELQKILKAALAELLHKKS